MFDQSLTVIVCIICVDPHHPYCKSYSKWQSAHVSAQTTIAAHIECECISTNDGKYTKQKIGNLPQIWSIEVLQTLLGRAVDFATASKPHIFWLLQAMGGLNLRIKVSIVYFGASVDTYSSGFRIFFGMCAQHLTTDALNTDSTHTYSTFKVNFNYNI